MTLIDLENHYIVGLAQKHVPRQVFSFSYFFSVLLLILLIWSLCIMYILGSASYQVFEDDTEDDTSFSR